MVIIKERFRCIIDLFYRISKSLHVLISMLQIPSSRERSRCVGFTGIGLFPWIGTEKSGRWWTIDGSSSQVLSF